MSDAKEVLEHILNDEKLLNSKLFRDKVFTDEPIIRRASQMKNAPVPKEISEMKAIAYTPEAYWKTSSWLFYQQGCLMKDYTDDQGLCENFVMYYPTYRDMNTVQLRSYFSWRTQVRNGIFSETRLPFILLYAYELINGIGTSSPWEGYEKLCALRRNYGPTFPAINKYLAQWITDYSVCNQLDPLMLNDSPEMVFDKLLMVLINYENASDDELWNAVTRLSSFPIDKSRFYNENSELFRQVAVNVYRKLSDFFRDNRKNSLVDKYFGHISTSEYHPYYAAVYYNSRRIKSAEYKLNDIHRYWCANGMWYCEKYSSSHGRNKKLGDLMRTIDSMLRERFGFKYKIKPGDTTKIVVNFINEETDSIIREKQRKEAAEIRIDLSLLGNIRSAADSTREKLLVDEEDEYLSEEITETPAVDTPETVEDDESRPSLLDTAEQLFLAALLSGGNYKEAAKNAGSMPSILADSINDKLFDEFGDTVIDFSSDSPQIIEDYAEDLKNYIQEVDNENT